MMWKQWIQFGFLLGIGLQSPALGMERLEEPSASATAAAKAEAPMPASEKPCAPGALDTVLGHSDLFSHILSFLSHQMCRENAPFKNYSFNFLSYDLRDILNMAKCNYKWHALVWGLPVWENIVFSANPADRTPISLGPNELTQALRKESLGAVKHLILRADREQHLGILNFFPGLETFIPHMWDNPHVLEAALRRLPKDLKHLYLYKHAILRQRNLSVLSRFQDLKSLDVSVTDLRGQFLAYLPSTLEELDMTRTQMTPDDGKQLAKFPKLSKLLLGHVGPGGAQIFLTHAPETLTHLEMTWADLATMDPQILKRFPHLRTFSPLSRAGLRGDREFQTPSRINAVLLGLHPEALQHLSADMDFRFATLGEENLPVFKKIQGWKNLVLPDSLDTPGLLREIIRIASPTLKHLAFKKIHEDHSAPFDPRVLIQFLSQCVRLQTFKHQGFFLDINDVGHLPSTMTHLHLSGEDLLTEGSAPSYGRFKNLTSLALDRVTQRQSVIEILQNVCPDHVRTIYLSPNQLIEYSDDLLPLLMRFKNLKTFFGDYCGSEALSLFKQKLKASMPKVEFRINYDHYEDSYRKDQGVSFG